MTQQESYILTPEFFVKGLTPEQIKEKITVKNWTPDYYNIALDIDKLCEFLSTLTK